MSDRQELVDRLIADPPAVHIVDTDEGKRPGVWATEESCYRFIASVATPAMRSLETGSGLSTALFTALGTEHICVTPAPEEAEHLRSYFAEKGIDSGQVRFIVEPSHVALPRLSDPVDIVLIDGGHGYPMPILDWFYACGLLRRNGTLIVDDITLPAVIALLEFLEHDPRWQPLRRTDKWAAFRRLAEGPLVEGQWDQLFYTPLSSRLLARRLLTRVHQQLRARLAARR